MNWLNLIEKSSRSFGIMSFFTDLSESISVYKEENKIYSIENNKIAFNFESSRNGDISFAMKSFI
jgi:hypothetical protein